MKIVRTKLYGKSLKRMGMTAADRAALEASIALNPTAGDVVQGLRGIRKIGFPHSRRGKRGGGRAVYFVVVASDMVIMLLAYAKNQKADLTPEDRRVLLALVEELTDD